MKKGFIVCIASLLFTAITFAASAVVDNIEWHYTVEDGNATIRHTDHATSAIPETTVGEIVIPATLNGHPVIAILTYAFLRCSGLTRVTIPESVISIGDWAFAGCSGLTRITIPEGVTSIGESAFSGCSGLTSVTIPKGVTFIEWGAFDDCSGLRTLTFEGDAPVYPHDSRFVRPLDATIAFPHDVAFKGIHSDLVIYYYEGATGWRKSWWSLFHRNSWLGIETKPLPARAESSKSE